MTAAGGADVVSADGRGVAAGAAGQCSSALIVDLAAVLTLGRAGGRSAAAGPGLAVATTGLGRGADGAGRPRLPARGVRVAILAGA